MTKRIVISLLLVCAAIATLYAGATLVRIAVGWFIPWWLGVAVLLVLGQLVYAAVYLAVAAWRTLRSAD